VLFAAREFLKASLYTNVRDCSFVIQVSKQPQLQTLLHSNAKQPSTSKHRVYRAHDTQHTQFMTMLYGKRGPS
jgi:hypothetical protein